MRYPFQARRRAVSLAAFAFAAVCAGCGGGNSTPSEEPQRNAAACTDFYSYANAAWIAATPIPPEGSSLDITSGVAARNQTTLLEALTALGTGSAAAGRSLPADQQALATLLASRADAGAVERAGLAPIADDLALIDRLTDTAQLPATWGLLVRRGVLLPVTVDVVPFDDTEAADPTITRDRVKLALETTAPSRAPNDDPESEAEFTAHVARTLALLGSSEAEAEAGAQSVLNIEKVLALKANGQPGLGPLADAGTAFDTAAFLRAAGVPDALPRVFNEPASTFLTSLQQAYSAGDFRAFMRWRLASSYSDSLPKRFADERLTWDAPRAPQTVDENLEVNPLITFLSAALPRQLDLFFVDRLLPAGAASNTLAISTAVRAALHRHLDTRAWLNPKSRAASHALLEKLDLAFPALDNRLDDQATAAVAMPALRRDALLGNLQMLAGYNLDRRLALAMASRSQRNFAGDAWWRDEARYNYLSNSVVVGPKTLETMLSLGDTPAARYGTVGTVMAHEMLHAFAPPADASFTPLQSLAWLDDADRPYVNGKVARMASDYASYVATRFGAQVVTPRFMGEDLSDIGSVPVALSALRTAEPTVADAPAFFRAYASSLRTRQSQREDLSAVTTVPAHAIYTYRANAPLSESKDFAQVHGCVAGDPMVRGADTRIDLW